MSPLYLFPFWKQVRQRIDFLESHQALQLVIENEEPGEGVIMCLYKFCHELPEDVMDEEFADAN